jgi:hypothetical protein
MQRLQRFHGAEVEVIYLQFLRGGFYYSNIPKSGGSERAGNKD